jgi:hypothetical protein
VYNREFKLRVIRQTANARQRKILRYQALTSKWTCCFKTEIHNYSFDAKKKIWNDNIQRTFCQESLNLPFAVPGNVKLKLHNMQSHILYRQTTTSSVCTERHLLAHFWCRNEFFTDNCCFLYIQQMTKTFLECIIIYYNFYIGGGGGDLGGEGGTTKFSTII